MKMKYLEQKNENEEGNQILKMELGKYKDDFSHSSKQYMI